MAKIRPVNTSSKSLDLSDLIKEDHRMILELFHRYLGTPADSREALAQQILDRLASHLEMEETVLFHEIRKMGSSGQTLLEDAEVEHEEVLNMVHDLKEAESDDDESWDALFEDMMRTVRVHFATEQQDLLPLIDHSSDA